MAASDAQSIPIYQRIRDSLRERIENGRYQEGDRLPSESELMKEFGAARMTIRQALTQLAFENLIVTQPGLGRFVAAKKTIIAAADSSSRISFEEQIHAQGETPTLQLLGFKKTAASPEVADRLQVAPHESIYCLERLRFVDGELIGLEIRYLLEDVGRRIPAWGIETMPIFGLLEVALNEPLGTVDVSIFASSASKQIAAKLKILAGAPVLVREQVMLDKSNRTVLFGKSIYRGNLHFRHVFRDSSSGLSAQDKM